MTAQHDLAPEMVLANRMDEVGQADTDGLMTAGAMVIRRLHARVQELEQEMASIGAGGVEPLRRRHDLGITRLTERGATAWAGVDAQALREGQMPHNA